MVWIIALAAATLALLVAFGFTTARRSLTDLEVAVREAWPALRSACDKRQELMQRIVALCARPLADRPEMLERVRRTGAAVIEAAARADALSLAAADNAHRAAVAELLARAGGHSQLSGSQAFAALCARVATLDSRIDVERERYNDAVGVFNVRRGAMPFRLAARAAGIQRAEFLA